MTTPNTVRKTFSAIINGKTETDPERELWKVEADIPNLSSRFPTGINRVPSSLANQLVAKRTYTLLLERQGVKKNRDGVPYEPDPNRDDLDWMFWWGLVAVNPQGEPAQSVSAPAQSVPAGNRPDHQDLIMIQHAFDKTVVAKQVWLGLPEKTRGTFRDFQIELAQDATWLLDNVYRSAGYTEEALEIEVEEEVLDQSPVDGGEDEPY